MRTIIQRVKYASVSIDGKIVAKINTGLLIFVGIENNDSIEDIKYLCSKISMLRIFNDDNNAMNKSVKDINGDILLVSQFTLHAATKKGNRPSFIKAAKPSVAIPLYKSFCNEMEIAMQKKIETGVFGADMQVELVNDGPVTISIDSKNKDN